jgi:hypothetical protein
MTWAVTLFILSTAGLAWSLFEGLGVLVSKGLSYLVWMAIYIFAPTAERPRLPGETLAGWVAPLFLASAVGAATGLIWMLLIQAREVRRSRRQNLHDSW